MEKDNNLDYIKELEDKISLIQTENNELKDDLNLLEEINMEISSDLDRSNNNINIIRYNNSKLTNLNTELKLTIEKLNSKISFLEQDNLELIEDIQTLKKKNKLLKLKVKKNFNSLNK